jgi:PST family polysaccharide transporter
MLPKFFKNKEVLLNTGHNYLNKAMNALIPIFLIPYYNKMFGVEQYGILIYIQAVAILLIYITDYGFIVTGTREVSANADNLDHLSSLVSSVIVVKLILTAAVFAGLLIISYVLGQPNKLILLYSLTFLALTFQNFMPSWFFQGMKKNFIITISNLFSKALLIVLVVVFINSNSSLWIVPFIEGISYFLFFMAGLVMAYFSFEIKFKLPSLRSLADNFVLSKDNFLITLLSWITTGGILVLTEKYVSSQSFGYYGIFTRITYYLFIAVHQINLSIFPYISERYSRSMTEGQILFNSITKVYMASVVALLAGGLVFGALFFRIFFDTAFVGSLGDYIPTFYLLVFRVCLLLANSYLGLQFFVANKNDRLYRNYYVVNVILSVAACFILVPGFGILGAAIGANLGEAVMFILLLRSYYSLRPNVSAGS